MRVLLTALMFCSLSFATEHDLTTLKGPGIDLRVYDHAIAGSINDFVFFGQKLNGKFASEMTIKKNGQGAKGSFGVDEARTVGGWIQSDNGALSLQVRIHNIDTAAQTITLAIGEELVAVSITADAYENSHFQNPTYSFEHQGKAYHMTLKGEACYGFSQHMLMMIIGAIAF